MVEIECLACGKSIKPRQLNDTENYDTDNYDGQVVCQECESLLYVKLEGSKVRKSKVVEKNFRRLTGDEVAQLMAQLQKEEHRLQKEKSIMDDKGDELKES